MQLGEILRETRERYGMTQEQLGNMVAYERSMISNMECDRREASPDYLARLQARLRDTKLAVQSCGHCQQGGLLSGVVIGDLDGHFAELLDVAHQEMEEFQVAFERFLVCRRTGNLEQEQSAALDCEKQAWDLIPVIVNLSIGMNQQYGIYHQDVLSRVNTAVQSLTRKVAEKRKAASTAAR